MLAFGIDPGSHRTGWGVVKVEGNRMRFVDAGVVRMRADLPLAARLAVIFEALSERLDQVRPDRIFLESVFHHKSAKSALVLGHARGVALLVSQLRCAAIGELTPAEVKKAVTGNGRAEKFQVQEMVRLILGLKEPLALDASDALAIAIAGSQRHRSSHALSPASPVPRSDDVQEGVR